MTAQPSTLRVLFLGTGEAFGKKANTSILINGELLLDCGFTTLMQLRKANIPLANVRKIILSHFHGDHTFALPALLVASLEEGREHPLDIFSLENGKRYVKQLLELSYRKTLEDLGFEVNFSVADTERNLRSGDYLFSFSLLNHSVPSLSTSVTYKGVKVTYLADGSPTKQAEKMAEGSDLLIAEAYQEGLDTHSSPLRAARIAKEQNVKKLALVHIYRGGAPSLDKAKRIFPELVIPKDLQEFTFL